MDSLLIDVKNAFVDTKIVKSVFFRNKVLEIDLYLKNNSKNIKMIADEIDVNYANLRNLIYKARSYNEALGNIGTETKKEPKIEKAKKVESKVENKNKIINDSFLSWQKICRGIANNLITDIEDAGITQETVKSWNCANPTELRQRFDKELDLIVTKKRFGE